MNQRKSRILFPVLGIVVLYIFQFLAHRTVPFMMDDEWYSTNLTTGMPLQTVADVLEGQVWHYLNWGGRSITHGILQLTLMSGELMADILNVVMTLALAYMICVVSELRSTRAFLLASSLLISLNANAKMSMFWQAGLVNYVYSSVWILLFLWFYIHVADHPEDSKVLHASKGGGILLTVGMLVLGLITGWSNENMGPTCFVLAGIVIFYRRQIQKKQIPAWMYAGALTSLAGSMLVILAPGNFVRSATIEDKSLLGTVIERIYSMYEAGIAFLFPVVLILTVLLILYITQLGGKLRIGQMLLLFGMLLSYGAMVLSPHYPDRATFGTMVLGIVVINSLIAQITELFAEFGKYVNVIQISAWIYGIGVILEIMMQDIVL